jgi:hypothetical protein
MMKMGEEGVQTKTKMLESKQENRQETERTKES